MALSYESTRGGQKGVTASQAILKGLAEDGGLFMPTEIPKLDKTLEQLAGMTYQETAYEVMKLFSDRLYRGRIKVLYRKCIR